MAVSPPRRLFVSEKLVLNVYSEPEQAGSRVGTIETGDAVDELERGEGFVRIRLSDGREGWVGTNYLTICERAAAQSGCVRGRPAPALCPHAGCVCPRARCRFGRTWPALLAGLISGRDRKDSTPWRNSGSKLSYRGTSRSLK